MAVVVTFHRHDLGWLIFKRIETVRVARENLDRGCDGNHPHRHREHLASAGVRAVAEQMPRADRAHD
jgi:hypothetical protein